MSWTGRGGMMVLRQYVMEDRMNNEAYMRKCYELAISSGKKGYDTFGAIMVKKNNAGQNS